MKSMLSNAVSGVSLTLSNAEISYFKSQKPAPLSSFHCVSGVLRHFVGPPVARHPAGLQSALDAAGCGRKNETPKNPQLSVV